MKFFYGISIVPCPQVKGTVSREEYSFYQYFLCKRHWFSITFKSFSLPYTIIKFLVDSLKQLTNSENAYLNPPQNSLLSDCSMFSSVDPSMLNGCSKNAINLPVTGGFRHGFIESLAASCVHFHSQNPPPPPPQGPLKRITERIIKIRC